VKRDTSDPREPSPQPRKGWEPLSALSPSLSCAPGTRQGAVSRWGENSPYENQRHPSNPLFDIVYGTMRINDPRYPIFTPPRLLIFRIRRPHLSSPYPAVGSTLFIEAANMIKAAIAIIPPKIKGAPGVIYFQRKPAMREERKVRTPIRV